jgi:hypothetical protein
MIKIGGVVNLHLSDLGLKSQRLPQPMGNAKTAQKKCIADFAQVR